MMFKKLLTNRKIVIAVIVLALVVCLGIILLETTDSKISGGKDVNNDSLNLEVLEPDEVPVEDSSDASGSWDNVIESDTQTGNADASDKKDDTDQTDNRNESNNPNDGESEENGDGPEKDEDILEDDITWGDVY